MPKVKKIFFRVDCDGCGENLDEEFYLTNDEIKEQMWDLRWIKKGKEYLCPDCQKKLGMKEVK